MKMFALLGLAALTAAEPASALAGDCEAAFERARATAAEAVFVSYVGFAPVTLNGDGPHWMLVDTGANRSALDAALARRLGLPELASQRVEGSAGVIQAGSTRIDRLTLGTVVIAELSPTTSDLSGLTGPGGAPVAGILGADAFHEHALLLDFRGGRIGLSPPIPAESGCLRVAPFTLDNGVVRYTARLDGHPVELRHDSGAGLFESDDTHVNLTESQFARVAGTGSERVPITHFSASGTGGDLRLPVYQGHSLELGPLSRSEPRLIVQPPRGYFARGDAVGFVGNYVFWSEGAMLLDYPGRRVLLPPRP